VRAPRPENIYRLVRGITGSGYVVQTVFALRALCVVSAIFLSETVPTFAQDAAPVQTEAARPGSGTRDIDTDESLCLIIESAAKANNLPLEFFARVIWQESRFQSNAVGPVTRSGQHARGIAQFMPGTASERRLLDPFDPVQALPKSAEFLNELRDRFGNLGLAAAAYNAGPKRVQDWLAGTGAMPQETRNYVLVITGIGVDDWAASGKSVKLSEGAPNSSCRELIALLKRAPNHFVAQLENRVRRAAVKLWGVQVAAGFNRDHALAMYASAMKGLSAVFGRQDDPNFQPLLFRSRGTSSFYQVRIGTDRRREADDLCGRIRRAGGACLVKRNRDVKS
jgi:hypothetical protein